MQQKAVNDVYGVYLNIYMLLCDIYIFFNFRNKIQHQPSDTLHSVKVLRFYLL